jgi:hypothetical protein
VWWLQSFEDSIKLQFKSELADLKEDARSLGRSVHTVPLRRCCCTSYVAHYEMYSTVSLRQVARRRKGDRESGDRARVGGGGA